MKIDIPTPKDCGNCMEYEKLIQTYIAHNIEFRINVIPQYSTKGIYHIIIKKVY